MPLLNNKRVPLTAPPPYDPKRKRKEVWYLRFTHEIFTNYEDYINRLMLYHQPIWECEVTGRSNLTYEQALESEGRDEHNRVEFRFCETLRRRMLHRLQFQTCRLEPLVEDLYNYFRFNFAVNEVVHCKLGDQVYLAKILDILPGPLPAIGYPIMNGGGPSSHYDPAEHGSSSDETETESNNNIPRQPNGRLRFPDAFIHPVPSTPVVPHHYQQQQQQQQPPALPPPVNYPSQITNELTVDQSLRYRVQLINEYEMPIENCVRIVSWGEIRRDKRVFCRHVLQRFVRECAQKDSYIGAPWVIKPNVARQYNIDTTLPDHLQEAQDLAYAKLARKRKAPAKTVDEKEAEKRLRKEENMLQKAKIKEEKERQREERRKQAAVKYPIEDLDLPIYRKDPNMNWALIDMSPDKYFGEHVIPYPSGGRSPRPIPSKNATIPDELFETFVSIWSFLTVFSEPLKLTPFSIDDFERAISQGSQQPKNTILAESNVCLLNVIIREREQDIAGEIASGALVEDYLDSLAQEEDGETVKTVPNRIHVDQKETTFSRLRGEKVERGWRDDEQLRVGKNWDSKELKATDRKSWETVLIGCLNEIATPDLIPELDLILRHLVPRHNSTAAERERQYASLSMKHKLAILDFLVMAVNESTLIKEYMEQCQEQLTEFRRQKVELNKESKSLAARRLDLDRRDRAEKAKDSSDEESASGSDEDNGSDEEEDASANSEDSEAGIDGHERRHRSRQEKLKMKQQKRKEMEAMRKLQYQKQREAAKELKQKAEERRKLEEEERALRKKEEQLEKDMRKYMTLRIRPLGRDRFYNRYIYLDNIGTSETYGTGRLYVQSPSEIDIQMMLERERTTDLEEQPWGRGGGRWFILELMKAHGMEEESEWLADRMEKQARGERIGQSWWRCYSEPEEFQQLLAWLNPKGTRECKLKNELTKRQGYILESMKKRAQALAKSESVAKRATRARSNASTTAA